MNSPLSVTVHVEHAPPEPQQLYPMTITVEYPNEEARNLAFDRIVQLQAGLCAPLQLIHSISKSYGSK